MRSGTMAGSAALALCLASGVQAQEPAPAPQADILMDWLVPDDAAMRRAAEDLARALADLGYSVCVTRFGPDDARDVRTTFPPTREGRPGQDDVTLSLTPLIDAAGWAYVGLDDVGPDGFRVVTVDVVARRVAESGFVKVIGDGVRGSVYALHDLARRVRLQQWAPGQPLDLLVNPAFTTRLVSFHDNPGEAPFASRYRDPAAVVDAGFNGVIFHGLAGVCLYDAVDPRLVPEGSAARRDVLRARDALAAKIAAAKAEHLLVFLNGDEIALPSTALGLYGAEVAAVSRDGLEPLFSASKPKVHELLRATFDEVLTTFPDVDGVQVRTGEVYTESEPMLTGNNPTTGSDELHPEWTDTDKLAAVIDTIRDVVVVQHGKRFNQRVWGYYTSAHSDPGRWLELAGRIEPDPRLTFSFKQPRTDYWRWNTLNPNFGLGPHGQWAEFQMAREYEGKGAFPSYLGRYLAEGPTEVQPAGGLRSIRDAGVRGAWCWVRGGGWGGPYLQREEWVDLNTFAFARLLWDPDADPWRLSRDFAVLELGLPADRTDLLDRFEHVQRLSEEAVLKGRYIGPFIRAGHLKAGSGWTPDGNWTRDDELGVGDSTFPAQAFWRFMKDDGTTLEAIAEKDEALAAWAQLMTEFDALVEDLPPDQAQAGRWQELQNTARYGEAWMQCACEHLAACWRAYLWDAGGRSDEALRARADAGLGRSEAAWRRLTGEIAALPGVASGYEEHGFSQEREAVRAMLAGGLTPKLHGGGSEPAR